MVQTVKCPYIDQDGHEVTRGCDHMGVDGPYAGREGLPHSMVISQLLFFLK